MDESTSHRAAALSILQAGLAAADPRLAVKRILTLHNEVLTVRPRPT